MRRLFPHPYMTLLLIAVWLLLVNRLALGSLVMAALLGTAIPLLTSAYWPARPRLKSPLRLGAYVLLVMWDIVLANIQVAAIVLFKPSDKIKSAWITVPLDLTSPEAITVFAGTISLTPGTVSADVSACGKYLLVHALYAPHPVGEVAKATARYEARVLDIFTA